MTEHRRDDVNLVDNYRGNDLRINILLPHHSALPIIFRNYPVKWVVEIAKIDQN